MDQNKVDRDLETYHFGIDHPIGHRLNTWGMGQAGELPIDKEEQDLRFVSSLISIEDFSICGSLWTTQKVNDLWPLTELQNLQVLRFFSTRVLQDGLLPLHKLKNLVKILCDLNYSKTEVKALREALPFLKCGTPIDFPDPIARKEELKRYYAEQMKTGGDPAKSDRL